jgi:acetyl-CoA acyltransferase
MRDVFVIGVGMTKFGKFPQYSIKDLTGMAVGSALADAGIVKDAVQAVWFSNSMWGYFSNQHCIRGQVALRDVGIMAIPIINVESACSSGSTAFHSAWFGVAGGLYDCVMAVGVEKLYNEDREKAFSAFFGGADVEKHEENLAAWRKILEGLHMEIPVKEDPSGAGKDRTFVMDAYACMIRWHMATHGTTQRHLAVISSKNHFHSSMNPYAQHTKEMSVDEILASRPVVWPLTVPMCAPLGDGGASAILCSGEFLKRLSSARPVKVLASVIGSCTNRMFPEEEKDIARRLSKQAYDKAGVGPNDLDIAELHDASAFGELHVSEAIGLCGPGEGGPYAESGATRLGGSLPINVSGGLECRGHPLGATGLGQIHELVTQLRDEGGKRQVEGARIGLSENGGGMVFQEEASMCIHILERVAK